MLHSNYKIKNTAQRIVIFFIAIFCAVFFLINCVGKAFASETGDIMQDLSTLTIDGKAFNAEDYPADAEGTPQLIAAYELGYSFYINNQDDFGLLLYIYNPSQIEVVDDIRNAVQLKTGNASRYDKYALKLIELSEDKLFCKFKVDFTDEEKATVLENVDRDSRRYEVSSIEIYEDGTNATSYPIERVYIFTGYGKGYGQSDGESTLSGTLNYTEEGGTETVPLEVHHTTWRPEGSKEGAGKYVQDSIHSVYFAVSNDVASQYDYLNSVKCEWLEALTAPIFVTGNAEVYKAVQDLIVFQILINTNPYNEAPEEFDLSQFKYALAGGTTYDVQREYIPSTCLAGDCMLTNDFSPPSLVYDSETVVLNTLFWNIFAGEVVDGELIGDSEVGDYTVTSGEIANYAKNYRPFLNDNKVAGKYPSYLFESWESQKHVEVIPVGKEYTLTSEKIVQSFWEKIFGGSHVENKEKFKAYAIQEVESLTYNQTTDCANYYISERDYDEFKAFYKANKDDATIYLLRFATSEYTQMQVMQFDAQQNWLGLKELHLIDRNAYFAQTKTYLNFDIIDLEYVKEDISYVIPVNMSPIDIFPKVTPPVYWDTSVSDFWKYGTVTIAGLIAFYVVYKVADKTIKEKANGR
ncbi:MAG: hypothetical protein ACI4MQ_01740 [Candidatus Coproplasma sp.]